MHSRKPQFWSWSSIVVLIGVGISIVINLATNYLYQPICFGIMVGGAGMAIVLVDYAERRVAYEKKLEDQLERQRTHWQRLDPLLRIVLWRTDYLWRQIEQYAIGGGEVLQLVCLILSDDKRYWQRWLDYKIDGEKHSNVIERGRTWIAKVETRSHDGTPKIIPLTQKLKDEIADAQHKAAFDNEQTALVIPIYDLLLDPAKTPQNMIAVLVIYSTYDKDTSILNTDVVMADATKIGEKLNYLLSYGYLVGERVEQ